MLALAGASLFAHAQPPPTQPCELCPRMVTVPAGVVTFGSRDGEHYRQRDETPQVTMLVAEFEVARYEVTRGEFANFVRATNFAAGGNCLTDRRERGNWQYDAETNWRDPGFAQGDDHPVACVSFEDAQAYIAWLNATTGNVYRLLTEIEWEYIASAGADTSYPWGNDPAQGCTQANGFDQAIRAQYSKMDTSGYRVFDPLDCNDGWINTNPVGALAPNRFGVHDMIGNVAEWVTDCYTASHDALTAAGTPASLPHCARRIAKGGSWGTLAHNLRTAERFPYAAAHRDDSIGLRLARTP